MAISMGGLSALLSLLIQSLRDATGNTFSGILTAAGFTGLVAFIENQFSEGFSLWSSVISILNFNLVQPS